MMRNLQFAALAAVLLLTLFSTTVRAQDERAVMFIEVRLLATSLADPADFVGSGFLIDQSGHILTAAHVPTMKGRVALDEVKIHVRFGSKFTDQIPAQVVECGGGDIDICLLKSPASAIRAEGITEAFVPVCRALRQGDRIVSKGFPPGTLNDINTVNGMITGDLGAFLKYPSDVSIQAGTSGGPVIDENGNVVAMNTGVSSTSDTFAFVQPLSYGIDIVQKAGVTCEAVTTGDVIAELTAALATASPRGAVMPFDLPTCPAGWAPYAGLDGRVAVGTGTADGKTFTFGEVGGVNANVLSIEQLPPHSHSYLDYSSTPGGSCAFSGCNGRAADVGEETGLTGGNVPVTNLQPYRVLTYCVRQ